MVDKSMIPSEEQIKKFWEWCGFRFQPATEEVKCGKPVAKWSWSDHWVYPNGQHHGNLTRLDLNSIFRYAVPKLSHYQKQIIFNGWASFLSDDECLKSPELSLFGLIMEVVRTPRRKINLP